MKALVRLLFIVLLFTESIQYDLTPTTWTDTSTQTKYDFSSLQRDPK